MKLSAVERKAIEALRRGPLAAGLVGQAVWPNRTNVGIANHGGGDYAAQMLLGRLRKRGLVETTMTEGSSRWQLTMKGYRVIGAVA